MKRLSYALSIIILFSISGKLMSQDAAKELDRVFGPDQTLINGEKYDYCPPAGTKGSQYLATPEYLPGSVTLKGKCYRGLTLNYDIYNQQILLKYQSEIGFRNIIEVSKAWLQAMSLGAMDFELLTLDKEPRIYQVLGKGAVRILYYWRKGLDVDVVVGSNYLAFTRAVRDSYILMDGRLKPFGTNRGLIRLFDPGLRPEIKSYLRKNKIRVKKSSDQVMAKMITFIGNIK